MFRRLSFILFFCSALLFLIIVHEIFRVALGSSRIHFFLVVVLFVSIIVRYTWALAMATIGGIVLDGFTPWWGSVSIPLLIAVLATNFLFLHYCTNRSLPTLILLGGVATFITNLSSLLWTREATALLSTLTTQLFAHTMLLIFFFFIVNTFTTRLKPYILVRS